MQRVPRVLAPGPRSAARPAVGDGVDVMVPPHALAHKVRARPPKPFTYNRQAYDVMGVDSGCCVLLRDQRAVHQDVRIESLIGREARYNGTAWRVAQLEAKPGLGYTMIRLVASNGHEVTPTNEEAMCIEICDGSNDRVSSLLGEVRHGIVRMRPLVDHDAVPVTLHPGQRFEARLRNRELEGVYEIVVGDDNMLVARGTNRHGTRLETPIVSEDVAPRYESVYSQDFGSDFDVDAFDYRLDQVRSTATHVGTAAPDRKVIQDPLFGSLSEGVELPLTNGAEHLGVFEQFIRKHTVAGQGGVGVRSVTVFNISMSPQGDAQGTLDALIEFRRQNPDAEITIIVSKLGPTEFQESIEFRDYLETLARNGIKVDTFTGADGPTRQVVHGKGLAIDSHVLFSTGSVMDTKPINKADFSIELPPTAALAFRRYTDEALHGDASCERRSELASELARMGVVVNDPVAGLPYISRLQDALIRGAAHGLVVSVSELRDPGIARMLIRRAAEGVAVVIQVRELDDESRQLLDEAMAKQKHPNLLVEDSSTWEPRPHFNAIVADGGSAAYVGTSYLWPTQRNFIHQGRSFENGVVLSGSAAASVMAQMVALRARALGALQAAEVAAAAAPIAASCRRSDEIPDRRLLSLVRRVRSRSRTIIRATTWFRDTRKRLAGSMLLTT